MSIRGIRPASLVALAVVLVVGSSLLVMSGCNGSVDEQEGITQGPPESPTPESQGSVSADEWVVIHANRVEDSSTPGGPVDLCTSPAGKEIAWLPACLKIKAGDTIGFANYYRDDEGGKPVTVELEPVYFGVAEIVLGYTESAVLEVIETPTQAFNINIVLGISGHGGPVMIPKEDEG
jgi:hypothetical protein